MIAHLWVSTATASAAVALVLLLRNASARIRFALLLLATLRFAIPTPWLTAAGEALAACLPSHVISAQVRSLEGLLHPGVFVPAGGQAAPLSNTPIVEGLWLLGALVSLGVWIRRSTVRVTSVRAASSEETAALERAAVRMGVAAPPLRIAASGFTPAVAGVWRSEVMLPCDSIEILTAEELESGCARELAHIRRRDNLSAAISQAIAAVFWFHPLVWWMERRMRAERELACDEMVVASGPREAYATALSKVCLASPGMHGSFAGMAGPNLTQRLERIMSNKFTSMGRGFRSLPAALALLAALVPVGAGFLRAQGPTRVSEAIFQQAYDCYNRKDYAQAETMFRRMIAEYPSDSRGASGLAEVYFAQNRQEEAVRTIRELAEKDPASFANHVALGNILVRTEQYTQAITEYQTALKLATTTQEGEVYFKMGETYRRMGRLDEAVAAHRRAKDLSTNNDAALQLALLLDGTGQSDQAEAAYRAILVKDPEHTVALNNLAYRLAERGENLDEALNYALRAQKATPESADIADTVGWIYLKKRMPDQAVPLFKGALLADQLGNSTYRQHLAAALDLKADWTPARRELRMLLETALTTDQMRRMQELLRASQ